MRRRAFAGEARRHNGVPVGVQVVAAHHREDLCLLAGRDIEAGGVPVAPVDPVQ
ncbi:hypothetical protein LGN19_27965 [Burkholderia sp. AU30198]|uniref:hypothetical protein n=1 Tax=Burkholderia sp. AU30198 TaxID=2879627 RepID=UPI001CF54D6F|nr:hypothetical protein [Burkholderia sp. AU30198]MCA8297631.1 hypothetical protein [Burkholderia sp. AU30198]